MNQPETMFNSRYTFESFVVGESNKFTYTACQAVAKAPSTTYNPLFIYGGVGLGKTHLLHAIGHCIRNHKPKKRIVYISSEQFTNELINSIRFRKKTEFNNKYRKLDILLVDDVQLWVGKERTQEEFFHIFNTLYESHKQIVLSSTRSPKEMPSLENHLRSRFKGGLSTEILPPDLETRIAILTKKTEAEKIEMPYEVIHFIANYVKYDVRELEGALNRIIAFSSLSKKKIDIALVKNILRISSKKRGASKPIFLKCKEKIIVVNQRV